MRFGDGFRAGVVEGASLAVSAALFGFAFGLVAAQEGWSWWAVGLMSLTSFAGSSQVVAVDRLATGEAALGAVLAGAAVNGRYLAMMATLAPMLRGVPWAKRLTAIHFTADGNWALALSRRARAPATGADFMLGAGAVMAVFWVGSTAGGALFGRAIPDPQAFGLGFAFTAAFVAMARGLCRGRGDLVPMGVALLVGAGLTRAGMPGAYATILAASACVAAHAGLRALRRAGRTA